MVDDGCCFSMTMITTMCSNSKATWPPLATRWWNYSALRFTAIVRLTHIQPHLNSYQERACINSSVSGVSCYCTNQIAGRDLCDCCSMMGNDVETVLQGPPLPPHYWDEIQKNSYFFSGTVPWGEQSFYHECSKSPTICLQRSNLGRTATLEVSSIHANSSTGPAPSISVQVQNATSVIVCLSCQLKNFMHFFSVMIFVEKNNNKTMSLFSAELTTWHTPRDKEPVNSYNAKRKTCIITSSEKTMIIWNCNDLNHSYIAFSNKKKGDHSQFFKCSQAIKSAWLILQHIYDQGSKAAPPLILASPSPPLASQGFSRQRQERQIDVGKASFCTEALPHKFHIIFPFFELML